MADSETTLQILFPSINRSIVKHCSMKQFHPSKYANHASKQDVSTCQINSKKHAFHFKCIRSPNEHSDLLTLNVYTIEAGVIG